MRWARPTISSRRASTVRRTLAWRSELIRALDHETAACAELFVRIDQHAEVTASDVLEPALFALDAPLRSLEDRLRLLAADSDDAVLIGENQVAGEDQHVAAGDWRVQ